MLGGMAGGPTDDLALLLRELVAHPPDAPQHVRVAVGHGARHALVDGYEQRAAAGHRGEAAWPFAEQLLIAEHIAARQVGHHPQPLAVLAL